MTAIYPGSAHVHCYAYVAHPRFESGPLKSTIFDVAIPAVQWGRHCQFFTCSLRVCHYDDVQFYEPGIYLIDAKIANFVPDIHSTSTTIPTSEFSLIGDILTIQAPLDCPHPCAIVNALPATIDCSGYVFVTDDATESFLVTVWQNITGTMPLTPLIVRGIIFRGELVGIENGITVVAVCDHSYFNFLDEAVDESQFHHSSNATTHPPRPLFGATPNPTLSTHSSRRPTNTGILSKEPMASLASMPMFSRGCSRHDGFPAISKKVFQAQHLPFPSPPSLVPNLTGDQNHKALDNPNVVCFLDCFEDEENVYMTLELCPSDSLMNAPPPSRCHRARPGRAYREPTEQKKTICLTPYCILYTFVVDRPPFQTRDVKKCITKLSRLRQACQLNGDIAPPIAPDDEPPAAQAPAVLRSRNATSRRQSSPAAQSPRFSAPHASRSWSHRLVSAPRAVNQPSNVDCKAAKKEAASAKSPVKTLKASSRLQGIMEEGGAAAYEKQGEEMQMKELQGQKARIVAQIVPAQVLPQSTTEPPFEDAENVAPESTCVRVSCAGAYGRFGIVRRRYGYYTNVHHHAQEMPAMKHVIVFKLSDDVLQFNFYDHSKIILSAQGLLIAHIDKNYVLTR
ncbi:hypothetical protein V8E53_006361 [Lactarius tabidus]